MPVTNETYLIALYKSAVENIMKEYALEIADYITTNSMETEINQYLKTLVERQFIYDYDVHSTFSADDIDNNNFPTFNISIKTRLGAEWTSLICTVNPCFCNTSKSKKKRIQIKLNDKLFQM